MAQTLMTLQDVEPAQDIHKKMVVTLAKVREGLEGSQAVQGREREEAAREWTGLAEGALNYIYFSNHK